MTRIAVTPYRRLHDYEQAIRLAGGEPWLVIPGRDGIDDVIAHAAGLLLPGGGDVDPALYGEAPHQTFEAAEAGRDAFEIALARRARDENLPLFAICRGIQVLNVARGGTLVQDIPSQVPSAGTHVQREPPDAIAHQVNLTPGTLLATLIDDVDDHGRCAVNSRHHQAVKQVGDGLIVTAAAPDGVIEALEDPDQRFCVGVQWHPENFYRAGRFARIFTGFVNACRQTASTRR